MYVSLIKCCLSCVLNDDIYLLTQYDNVKMIMLIVIGFSIYGSHKF